MQAIAWADVALGALATIVFGTATGWFFYTRSIREPQLWAGVSEVPVAHALGDDRIVFMFDGDRIPRVTAASITVMNVGRGVFRVGDHGDEKDPLGFDFPVEHRVLKVEFDMLAQSRDVETRHAQWVGGPDTRHALVPTYLNARESFKVTVMHTAKPGSIRPAGMVVGVGPVVDASDLQSRSARRGGLMEIVFLAAIGLALLLAVIF